VVAGVVNKGRCMCGICGKISLNGAVSENLMHKMCEVLEHRGPDDEGDRVYSGDFEKRNKI